MKKASSWLWGCILVALGVILGINALGIAHINIFFPGWWTLFIIVPCAVELVTSRHKGGPLVGLIIGLWLMLSCMGILSFGMFWKLLIPVVLVIVGIVVIMRGSANGEVREKIRRARKAQAAERHQNGHHETIMEATIVETDADGKRTTRKYSNRDGKSTKVEQVEQDEDDEDDQEDADEDEDDDEDFAQDPNYQEYWSTFSEQNVSYAGKDFGGCRIDAVFGSTTLDLRGAQIKNEAIVKTSSVFGNVTLYVPEDVKVEVASSTIFGGINDRRSANAKSTKKTSKVIYLDSVCIFGNVEIR